MPPSPPSQELSINTITIGYQRFLEALLHRRKKNLPAVFFGSPAPRRYLPEVGRLAGPDPVPNLETVTSLLDRAARPRRAAAGRERGREGVSRNLSVMLLLLLLLTKTPTNPLGSVGGWTRVFGVG